MLKEVPNARRCLSTPIKRDQVYHSSRLGWTDILDIFSEEDILDILSIEDILDIIFSVENILDILSVEDILDILSIEDIRYPLLRISIEDILEEDIQDILLHWDQI